MDPLTSTANLRTGEEDAEPTGHDKLLSSLRLKVLLSLFVGLLVAGLSGLTVLFVSQIFARLTPLMRQDLEWKARRGARDLAQSADLAIAVGDVAMVRRAFGDYAANPDVTALVAIEPGGRVVAALGHPPVAVQALFLGPENATRPLPGALVSWAVSTIEGRTVGRVAVVVSTARLAEGERLRERLVGIAGVGCLLALGLSLFFVNFYLVPLITLTQQGLRTAREMEIAKRIQTSILPRQVRLPGVELGAAMIPAAEVGGDYYDVIPVDDGCWIGVGDVAGHGVRAGLIMMMLQSIVAALVKRHPDAPPSEVLEILNSVLHENIRHRLRTDEHVTFCLLHLRRDGRMTYAGAHEPVLILRAGAERCDRLDTPGTWLGATRTVRASMPDQETRLAPGDLLVLHTDGITEMRGLRGDRYGLDRLAAAVERHRAAPAGELRARLMDEVARFGTEQDDDQTLLVFRYLGISG